MTRWSYYRRWGQKSIRAEPIEVIAVYRQSDQGQLQTAVAGKWTTVPGHLAPDDPMLDEIPEVEALTLAQTLKSPLAIAGSTP